MHRKFVSTFVAAVLLSATTTQVLGADDCIFIRDRDQRNLCKGDCIFIVDRDLRNLCKGVTVEDKKLPAQHRERREQDSDNDGYERRARYESPSALDEEEDDSGSDEYYVPSDDDRPKNRRGASRRH